MLKQNNILFLLYHFSFIPSALSIFYFAIKIQQTSDYDIALQSSPIIIRYAFAIPYLFIFVFAIMAVRRFSLYNVFDFCLFLYFVYSILISFTAGLIHQYAYKYILQDTILFISIYVVYRFLLGYFIKYNSHEKYFMFLIKFSLPYIAASWFLVLISSGNMHISFQLYLLPLLYMLFVKRDSILIPTLLTLTALFSFSRGTMINVLIVLFLFVFTESSRTSKKLFFLFSLITVLFFAYYIDYLPLIINRILLTFNSDDFIIEKSAYSRILSVIAVMRYFLDHATFFDWLIGFGAGASFMPDIETFIRYDPSVGLRKIENQFFNIFLRQGLIGLGLYVTIMLSWLYTAYINYSKMRIKRNKKINKILLIYMIIEIITMLRVDALGDHLLALPIIFALERANVINYKNTLQQTKISSGSGGTGEEKEAS